MMSEPVKIRNRTGLARFFAELGFRKGAEVGVFEGYYSKILLGTIPKLNLLCVDSWSTDTGWGLKKNVNAFPRAVEKLSEYPGATIIRASSIDAAKALLDESLDFVYIDADHSYDAVKADIAAWAPKVKKGGILSGHDYFHPQNRSVGVVPAVDEYASQSGLTVQTTEFDEENPVRDDRQPSWYIQL